MEFRRYKSVPANCEPLIVGYRPSYWTNVMMWAGLHKEMPGHWLYEKQFTAPSFMARAYRELFIGMYDDDRVTREIKIILGVM